MCVCVETLSLVYVAFITISYETSLLLFYLFACYYLLSLKWSSLYPQGDLPHNYMKPHGLRIGHANVYHHYYKVQDVCMLLTKSPHVHLLRSARPSLILVLVMKYYLFATIRVFGAMLHTVARMAWGCVSTTA